MVGLDSDSQPQNPQNNTQSSFPFNKGQEVEVSSDEDGFRGAWYMATIVDSPTKSASKKRKKVQIEYKSLVTDDGVTPLTEHVDVGFIRPVPPMDSDTGSRIFQENDVVDARYRDGWWTGIVRKVLEGSRYRIYFDNPPEVIDFDGKDLRVHWKWVNGEWVPPEKQQTTGSVFSSGTAVEVNIDKENVRDVWFPAVVIKENGDNTFLVKYQSSGSSDDARTKVNVDSLHIRPIPPRYADRNYELLEKVDAQYNFGWRAGLITKLLAGRRYNVFFKQGNEDKELNHLEIRPHAEWINGQWICKSKEIVIASDNKKHLGKAHNSTDNPEMSAKLERSGGVDGCKTEEKPCSTSLRNLIEQSIRCNEKSVSHVLPPSKKVKLAAPSGAGVRSRSSKKPTEEDSVDSPILATSSPLVEIPIETSTNETLRGLATTRTGGKRTRYSYSRKPMVVDRAAAKTESPPAGKRAVISQANRVLIRIKELPKKAKLKKDAEAANQKVDIVTRKGRSTKSPFRSPSAAVDAAARKINESEDKATDEIPVIIALQARGMRSSDLDYPSELSGEETLQLIRDQKKNLNDSGGKIMGLNQRKRGGSSQRRKRGRPRKLIIISSKASEAGKEDRGVQDVANELVVKDHTTNEVELPIQTRVESTVSQVSSRGKTGEVSETDCITKEGDLVMVSKDVADDDQPLSTWIGGIQSSANTDELRLCSGKPNGGNETNDRHVDLAIVSSVIDAQDDSVLDGSQCLPFLKRSLVWETIESMEVFQIMPQKPHFRPLADCKEEYREGTAIGIMVTFASLFEKITSLQFDDSKSILESTLESLLDLERHGFDVTIPRNRVNELLSIKEGKEELLNESKNVQRRIEEQIDERRKLDMKINDIEKKISELQEELAASKSKMETKDLEIASLQSNMDSMNGVINDARNTYKRIATAPWKLP